MASSKFVNYLQSEYERKKKINNRYSLRCFAKLLEIDVSLLSRLLNGKIPVTEKMLTRLAPILNFSDDSYQIFAEEILERTETEDTLRRSEERYRSVIQVVPAVLWAIDTEGIIIFSEGRGLEKLGYKAGELVGQSVFSLPLISEIGIARIRHGLTGVEYEAEVEFMGKYFKNHYIPKINSSGKVTGLISISVDITERKIIENSLRQKEKTYLSIIKSLPLILWMIDMKGIITLSEGKGLEKLNLKPGELVGLSVYELSLITEEASSYIRRGLAGEDFIVQVKYAGIIFENHYMPEKNLSGEIIGLSVISMDTTFMSAF